MISMVVTGATSMLGSALVRYAVKERIKVLCIVRKGSTRLDNIPKSDLIKIEYCDINEYCHLAPIGSYEIFYHFAWDKTFGVSRDDVDTQAVNIRYTLDAVRLAKRLGCKKFIGAGSQAEYGIVSEPLRPETPVNPESGYGVAKYAAGKLGRLLCKQLDLQFNWVRIVSTYGPMDGSQTLIMYTIHELLDGHSPEFTKCEQIWDYLYCDDAAKAFFTIGENGIDGKTYPLGSGDKKKLSEYIEIIKDIIDPVAILQFGKKEYYSHQPMYLCADITELTNDTEWRPEVTFTEGVKKVIESVSC